MRRAFIVHRWEGGSHDDWRPWLAAALVDRGYDVLALDMPDSDEPDIGKWVHHLEKIVENPDDETFFIGHSIGCQAILRYLETLPQKEGEEKKIGGAILVAGWFNLENLEDPGAEEIAKPWIESAINIEKVKKAMPKSTLVISDNDPYGAFEENVRRFSEFGSKIVIVPDAGHFTAKDGFLEFPLLLDELDALSG